MRKLLYLLIATSWILLSACVEYDLVRAQQAEHLSRLAHEDRDLRIAVNVVVERLREVEAKEQWQDIASLEPQIYQLAADLLPNPALSPEKTYAPDRYLGDSLPRISYAEPQKLPVLLPLVSAEKNTDARVLQASVSSSGAAKDFPLPPKLHDGRSMFFALHLGSYRDEQTAIAGWAELQSKAPKELAGLQPRLERVDLGAKGIFMRLKAGPILQETVVHTKCKNLQLKGLSCARADFTGKVQG